MINNTNLFAESWNVAWRKKPTGEILSDQNTPFNIIKNSLWAWAADPFIFENNGITYIFAELYDYVRSKGTIGYCQLNENGSFKWKKIIKEDFHMSYPCIYQLGDDIYIVPESSEAKELYVYKAISFPDKWKRIKVIRKNVKYCDTTPFTYDKKNYAVTYDVNDKNKYNFKLIEFSENSTDDYDLPTKNVNLKRPAGKFFTYKNKLLRPAQICEKDYGEGIIFYQVNIDSESGYSENEIVRIMPENLKFSNKIFLDGMHTYNSNSQYEIIDIKTRRFNLINLFFRIINHIKYR